VFEFRGESIGNHNRLLGTVDGVDGIKTGYISASGFNIITSVHRDNRFLIAVEFGGSSAGSRDERMRELIHDHIAEASVQHTATAIAEAATPAPVRPEAKPQAKPESRPALASATSVPFTLPAKSETKSEAKSETKPEAKSETKPAPQTSAPQTYAMASTSSVPITLTSKSDPSASTTVQVPRWAATTNSAPTPKVTSPSVGSEDPIHPVMVKTVLVKPGSTVQTASLAPLQLSAPAEPPAPAAAPATAAPQAAAPATTSAPPAPAKVALPFPPPGTRPGAIGGLPSRIITGSVVDPAPAAPAPSAAPVAPALTHSPAPAAAPSAQTQAPPQPQAQPQAQVQTHAGWIIQVGAFPAEGEAKQRLSAVQSRASKFLASADAFTETVSKGESVWYRARFAGLGKEQAEAACNYLKHNDVDCMTIKN
jgi:D-alanyl-D-alanine carboxypeptidase